VSRHDPFFWDTVQLGSKHAHHFYENGLKWTALPVLIDSGHPPLFGYYLALLWRLFGKSLETSHLAMLPFLLLNVVLLWNIGQRVAGRHLGNWFPMLVLFDPVVLGQSVMISPDVVLITGFLAALEGILAQRKWLIITGVLLLCCISMRGMMTAAALAVWTTLLPFFRNRDVKRASYTSLPFLPGFFFAAWFLAWHWQATGWIGYHPDSPWAGAFQRVNFLGFVKNTAIVAWRWLDFGRVGELIVFSILLYRSLKPKSSEGKLLWGLKPPIYALFICLLVFLLPSALVYQNLSAHRYFLPLFITVHLFVFQLIAQSNIKLTLKRWLLLFLAVCLLSGNLWIYPRGVSMDWDSTLAHWPYHALRADALQYLESNNVDFQTVGTAFPNLNTGENLLLNGDLRVFSQLNLAQNKFVFTSNVFNDISLSDYHQLKTNWMLVWREERMGVFIEIYERR